MVKRLLLPQYYYQNHDRYRCEGCHLQWEEDHHDGVVAVEILLHVIADVHLQLIAVEAHGHRDVDQELDREVPQIIHGIVTVVTRDQARAARDSNFLCTYKIRTEFDQTQFILVGRLNILSKAVFTDSFKNIDREVYALKTVHDGITVIYIS